MCQGVRDMERTYAKMQETCSHVEFVSYDGRYLIVAYML